MADRTRTTTILINKMSDGKKNNFKVSEEIDLTDNSSEDNWDDLDYFKSIIVDLMGTNSVYDHLCQGEDGLVYIGPFKADYIESLIPHADWKLPNPFDDITKYF